MRAVIFAFALLLLIACLWAVHLPLSSYARVNSFDSPDADTAANEEALSHAGVAAVVALQEGVESVRPAVRLRCARLLALQGDRGGDRHLLDLLRAHGKDAQDPVGGMAEAFLLSVWEERNAPDPAARGKLTRLAAEGAADGEQIAALNDCLARHPGWSAGYVRRGTIFQRHGRAVAARRDALIALLLDSENFAAMTLLSQAYLTLNAPDQAYVCIEQALWVNPRLRSSVASDREEILKALNQERERRREDNRLEAPVI